MNEGAGRSTSVGGATSSLGLERTYAAIHDDVAGLVVPIDVIRIGGPDALEYLQGQVSQDLDGVAVGGSVEALVLSPQGKLDGYVRVARTGEDEAVLVIDDGFGEALLERLARFKVRVKAELELSHWQAALVRGPNAKSADVSSATAVIDVAYPGFSGVDLVGPDVDVPEGVSKGDGRGFLAARIEAGVPAMGAELTERTIPEEAGIVARTVSFTKGCYTGQELVARIDARGNRVPRRLVGVVVESGSIAPGAELVHDKKSVGTVTSAAYSPRTKSVVCLAYLKRAVEVPASLVVASEGGAFPAEALALPLYSA